MAGILLKKIPRLRREVKYFISAFKSLNILAFRDTPPPPQGVYSEGYPRPHAFKIFNTLWFLIAPQASFEESATTEASRRCPLTGFLRDFGVLFSGHTFEASATDIGHLVV